MSRLPVASALRTLDLECEGLAQLRQALAGPMARAFAEALRKLRAARGRVIVTGIGKSGHIGQKMAATFASTGRPAFFVHPTEASHGDLGMITPDDVLLALSWSGETVELKPLITYSRRYNVPLIAITSRADSALGQQADIVLELPRTKEACPHGLAPTTSTAMQLVLGRLPRHRAARGQGLHGARVQGLPSRRLARRQPQVRRRRHAQGRASFRSPATPSP